MFNQISTIGYGLWIKASTFLTENGFVANAAGEASVRQILQQLMTLFPWIGAIFAVWGGARLVMALRNDGNPEAINGAARDLIVGIALCMFSALFGNMLVNLITSK